VEGSTKKNCGEAVRKNLEKKKQKRRDKYRATPAAEEKRRGKRICEKTKSTHLPSGVKEMNKSNDQRRLFLRRGGFYWDWVYLLLEKIILLTSWLVEGKT